MKKTLIVLVFSAFSASVCAQNYDLKSYLEEGF